jgi:hypothetical protein
MYKLNFKKWFEGGGGFIYGSMTDPEDDHPPSGSEITSDPYLRMSDFPPTKKTKKKKIKNKIAKFGFSAEDGGQGIRKKVLNHFV